jgi:hypothetical protein
MGNVVFDTVLPCIIIRGTTVAFISSQAGDPNCVGMRILSSRLPNGKPVVDIYTVGNVDGLAEALQNLAIHSGSKIGPSGQLKEDIKSNIINMGIKNAGKVYKKIAEVNQTSLLKRKEKRSTVGAVAPHQSIVQMQRIEAMMSTAGNKTKTIRTPKVTPH